MGKIASCRKSVDCFTAPGESSRRPGIRPIYRAGRGRGKPVPRGRAGSGRSRLGQRRQVARSRRFAGPELLRHRYQLRRRRRRRSFAWGVLDWSAPIDARDGHGSKRFRRRDTTWIITRPLKAVYIALPAPENAAPTCDQTMCSRCSNQVARYSGSRRFRYCTQTCD